jgi:hypothetical protein
MIFKFLRRNGYLEKLFTFKNELMDRKLSLWLLIKPII